MTDLALFCHWKAWLRKRFPSRYPVRVLLVPPAQLREEHDSRVYGDCFFSGQRFLVRIANNLNEGETRETLFHEHAHVLRDHLPKMPGDSDHDEVYAAIKGRIDRVWIGEIE